MMQNKSSPNLSSSTAWQILGGITLPVNAEAESVLHLWLTDILHPLELRADILSKILNSAKEALGRALQTEGTKFEHLHFVVYVPAERSVKGQAWGFFRIEKLKSVSDQPKPDHTIEFYLYLDG